MMEESPDNQSDKEALSPTVSQPKRGRDSVEAKTPPRVLIVEDEFAIAVDIQDQLTRLGYVVVGLTAFGEDAVELAAVLRPDLVLMDINLRGKLNGVAAAEQIRSRLSLAVVFVTANAALAQSQSAPPVDYILKPFEPGELATVVESAFLKQKQRPAGCF
jgi:CheY-like chemotaxis protein